MGAAAGAAPGARKPLPDFAASMSRAITRPCGPEPCTRLRSTFASFARRRASGEEKMRFAPRPLTRLRFGATCSRGREVRRVAAGRHSLSRLGRGSPRGAEASVRLGALWRDSCAPLAAAFTSSPSPASTAITAFTATSCVPSGTTILASVPSSTASYSMVALSVSISAMMSPDLILSPSFLSQRARLPFSMVGDSAGMRMLVGMARYR